jgi:hypothetical protein
MFLLERAQEFLAAGDMSADLRPARDLIPKNFLRS